MAPAQKNYVTRVDSYFRSFNDACKAACKSEDAINEGPTATQLAGAPMARPGFTEDKLGKNWILFATKFPDVATILRRSAAELRTAKDNPLKPNVPDGAKTTNLYLLISNPNYADGLTLAPGGSSLVPAAKVATAQPNKRKAPKSTPAPKAKRPRAKKPLASKPESEDDDEDEGDGDVTGNADTDDSKIESKTRDKGKGRAQKAAAENAETAEPHNSDKPAGSKTQEGIAETLTDVNTKMSDVDQTAGESHKTVEVSVADKPAESETPEETAETLTDGNTKTSDIEQAAAESLETAELGDEDKPVELEALEETVEIAEGGVRDEPAASKEHKEVAEVRDAISE